MFVTFEGLDGSGKTTQAGLLRARLEREGHEVVHTREPGGTPLGEWTRKVLLEGAAITAWAEAALFAAARAELVERVIRPALERGAHVVSDRYLDSSLAYQGVARGLGIEPVLALNLHATGGLLPDRTFLLMLERPEARARGGGGGDRIEDEGESFHRNVESGYRRLAELFPERVIPLDGLLPPDELAELVRERVSDLS